MKFLRLLLFLACGLASASIARAQITVSISIKERFHLLHEPIVATVVVTNLTGRDITFSDTPQYQWFAFRIITEGDRVVPARDLHYKLPPLAVKAGETVKRSVDLDELYDLGEFGSYRIQANVYFDGLDKFYSSRPTFIEITDGRVIWRRTVGVPEGETGAGQTRVFSLLAHQRGETNMLYVRVEDKENGNIYCTFPVGRLLDGVPPQAELDAANNLYVLLLIANRSYVLTKITPNGKFAGQTNYSGAPKSSPKLRKTSAGALQIVGGQREAIVQNPDLEPAPKLSARPPGLPAN